MHFIRIYLSGTQQYNTIQYNTNIFISGRTISKEFNTMIMDWLHWLEDDNIFMKQDIIWLGSPIT
jgi:hypothetical protein